MSIVEAIYGGIVIALVILGLQLVHAVVAYDDWRCAFAECRIVTAR
jgi:hypothetical protein